MVKYCFRLLVVAAVLSGLSAYAADPVRNIGVTKSEKRVALVIGNSAYPGARLSNPVNDAKDMASALRRLGFDVIEKTDATQKEMNRAIAQFGEKLRADTVALFYYAGHGMQVRGKNYLIPIDAQIASESSARVETVDVDGVLDQLSVSPLNIVILDACRNNPFERRFRSVGGGLAQMDAPKGSLIAYATAPGKVASDGAGRNGLYTQELLKHIQTPGLQLEAVFKRVRNAVMAGSGEAQTPWEASSLTGDFYFSPSKNRPAEPQAQAAPANNPAEPQVQVAPAVDSSANERSFWESVKDTKNPDELQTYIAQYPQGIFVSLATARLNALRTPSAPQTVAIASTATAAVNVSNSLKSKLVGSWTIGGLTGAVLTYLPNGRGTYRAEGGILTDAWYCTFDYSLEENMVREVIRDGACSSSRPVGAVDNYEISFEGAKADRLIMFSMKWQHKSTWTRMQK